VRGQDGQMSVWTQTAPPIKSNGMPNLFILSLERVNAPREVTERVE
jgi:hypothetical protein